MLTKVPFMAKTKDVCGQLVQDPRGEYEGGRDPYIKSSDRDSH
jgi:hypothetical protein